MKLNHKSALLFIFIACIGFYSKSLQAKNSIQVSNLEDVSLDSIGIDTKLGNDIWKNTDYDFFFNNLKNIKTNSNNKYYNIIARDILATSSIPPKGKYEKGKIIKLRLNKLIKLGYFDTAKSIIDQIADEYKTEEIKNLEAKIILGLEGTKKACKYLDKNNLSNLDAQKIRIVCNIYENEEDKAKLGLSLMFEEKNPKDDFITIAEAILENKSLKDDIKISNIETILLSAKKYSNEFILEHSSKDNYIYLILSNTDRADKIKELPILLKSYNKGLIKSAVIENIYKKTELKRKDKETYFEYAERVENNHLKIIAFYKEAKNTDDIKNQVRLAKLALNASENEDEYKLNANVFAKFIETKNPNIDLKSDIENIVELLIVAEKYNFAKLWYDFSLINNKDVSNPIHGNIIAISSGQEKYTDTTNFTNAVILSGLDLFTKEYTKYEEKIENIDISKIFTLEYAVKNKDLGKALLLSLEMIDSENVYLNSLGIKALDKTGYKKQARDIAISKLK